MDTIIAELARPQHGVLTRAQLLEAGLSAGRVDGLVRSRRLRPLHRGVYGSGPVLPPRATEMAAVLACGPGAVISHISAASLWALLPAGYGAVVDVTVPGGGHRGRRDGIRSHRVASLGTSETAAVDGVPVTAPARTILDLAAVAETRTLEQAVARAERRDLVDRADLANLAARHPGRRGIRRLRSLLDHGGGPSLTRSEAETRMLALIRLGGLPRPETNAAIGGFEVDFLWRDEGLAIEVDGYAFHRSRFRFERDRRRDAELAGLGIQVLRVTWRQITREPHATLARIARAMGGRG